MTTVTSNDGASGGRPPNAKTSTGLEVLEARVAELEGNQKTAGELMSEMSANAVGMHACTEALEDRLDVLTNALAEYTRLMDIHTHLVFSKPASVTSRPKVGL